MKEEGGSGGGGGVYGTRDAGCVWWWIGSVLMDTFEVDGWIERGLCYDVLRCVILFAFAGIYGRSRVC